MFRNLGLLLLLLLCALVWADEIDNAVGDPSGDDVMEPDAQDDSLVIGRIERERAVDDNRSVLLSHRRNYLLPVTWAYDPNDRPFKDAGIDNGASLDNFEAQFQISLKLPIAAGIFSDHDAIFGGFTLRAFWQVFNTDISAPFRESNYEPEIFWGMPVPWNVFGGDAALVSLGLSHQSNGRSQPLSRSWNRVYAGLVWERWRYVFHFKTWWRIPEDEKDDPLDADGDDNPDIEDFMGNFEFTVAYRKFDQEVSVLLRNNLDRDENHGAVQVDWTFPLEGRYRGYLQFFSGYGESLIDYDKRIQRLGVGIIFSDLL
jgi:phospholipase A1